MLPVTFAWSILLTWQSIPWSPRLVDPVATAICTRSACTQYIFQVYEVWIPCPYGSWLAILRLYILPYLCMTEMALPEYFSISAILFPTSHVWALQLRPLKRDLSKNRLFGSLRVFSLLPRGQRWPYRVWLMPNRCVQTLKIVAVRV